MKSNRYCYDYPRPALTADALIFTVSHGKVHLLLIQRKHPPYARRWALPGGFVNEGETLLQAALRELKEETGVHSIDIVPFGCYGDPGRDPRGWTVTCAFLAVVPWTGLPVVKGNDDATQARWHPVNKLPAMAFDHAKIVAEGLHYVRDHKGTLSLLRPRERSIVLATCK